MKSFLVGVCGIVTAMSSIAMADEPSLKITSFQVTGSREHTAEMCGKASGLPDVWASRVVITVDPGANQGRYVTQVDQNGNWCQIVWARTFRGEAELWNNGKMVSAASTK